MDVSSFRAPKGFYSFVGPEAQLKSLCQNKKTLGSKVKDTLQDSHNFILVENFQIMAVLNHSLIGQLNDGWPRLLNL